MLHAVVLFSPFAVIPAAHVADEIARDPAQALERDRVAEAVLNA